MILPLLNFASSQIYFLCMAGGHISEYARFIIYLPVAILIYIRLGNKVSIDCCWNSFPISCVMNSDTFDSTCENGHNSLLISLDIEVLTSKVFALLVVDTSLVAPWLLLLQSIAFVSFSH